MKTGHCLFKSWWQLWIMFTWNPWLNQSLPARGRSVNKGYPITDLVILAGGQARRMNGLNKLLQQFDGDTQLLKIHQKLKSSVSEFGWIVIETIQSIKVLCLILNVFKMMLPVFGPLMGMKSAWSHVRADYVLFIPCDVTYIPTCKSLRNYTVHFAKINRLRQLTFQLTEMLYTHFVC